MKKYELQIVNEKTGKVYSKEIDDSFHTFIDDDKWDNFLNKMEEKYNATMDYTGALYFCRYTIYEIDDESLFPIILNEWYNFFTTESENTKNDFINSIKDNLSSLGIHDDTEISDDMINNIMK